jgi:hypothetical protein
MAVDGLFGYAGEGVIMALFDFLVMAVCNFTRRAAVIFTD